MNREIADTKVEEKVQLSRKETAFKLMQKQMQNINITNF